MKKVQKTKIVCMSGKRTNCCRGHIYDFSETRRRAILDGEFLKKYSRLENS